MTSSAINRSRIAVELDKLLDAEQALVAAATARGESPPHPSLAVLYHEIANDDERHLAILQKVAVRYGSTPSPHRQSGVSEVLGRIKSGIVEMGTGPADRLRQDLLAKSDAINGLMVWAAILQSLEDDQSDSELTDVLKQDHAHHDALQEALKRVLLEECREIEAATPTAAL